MKLLLRIFVAMVMETKDQKLTKLSFLKSKMIIESKMARIASNEN